MHKFFLERSSEIEPLEVHRIEQAVEHRRGPREAYTNFKWNENFGSRGPELQYLADSENAANAVRDGS